MKRRFIAIVVAIALGCAALIGTAGCGGRADQTPEDLPPVHIGTLAVEDILPMWVAEEQGLFAEAGLDATITVFQSATELIAAVTAGEVDYAMTDPMVAASIFSSGTEVRIEWVTLGTTAAQGRFGIMTDADSGITSLADLAGKPIGVGSNTILEYVMDTLMLEAGIPEDQIIKEELQKLPVRYQQMTEGQVTAAALPASLLALGEVNGCVLVADDTEGANISQSVMIVNAAFLEDGGEATLEPLKSVWDKAASAINADPESFRALLAEKANLSDAVANMYPICEYPSCEMATNEMIDPVLTWMEHKGYLTKHLSYDEKTGCFSAR